MDSDNRPGPNAYEFEDMPAPQSFRLGWGKYGDEQQSADQNFSNDAMSSVKGSNFIERYLASAYEKLCAPYVAEGMNPQSSMSEIEGRRALDVIAKPTSDREKKHAVMTSTGPEQMRTVALGVPGELTTNALEELSQVSSSPQDDINIGSFNLMRELTADTVEKKRQFSPEKFPPEMASLFNEMGYSPALFKRFCGGAWHKDDNTKKTD